MPSDNSLNAEQLAAVTATEKDVIVCAGPGSGKTRVIAARVNHLLETGVDPKEIIVLTFTRKAAEELRDRINNDSIQFIGTIHAYCLRFFERFGGYKIMSETEATDLMNEVALTRGVQGVDIARAIKDATQWDLLIHGAHLVKKDIDAARVFIKTCKHLKRLPFDVLLFRRYEWWVTNTNKARSAQHLLVDEFQDTSLMDMTVYASINSANWFFVGDDKQSIYEWRGADPNIFFNISMDFTRYNLVTNYRSTPEIVNLGSAISREYMETHAESVPGSVEVIPSDSFDMKELVTPAYGSIGILCRYRATLDQVAEMLQASRIPFGLKYVDDCIEPIQTLMEAEEEPSAHNLHSLAKLLLGKAEAERIKEEAAEQCVDLHTKLPFKMGEGWYVGNIPQATMDLFAARFPMAYRRLQGVLKEASGWTPGEVMAMFNQDEEDDPEPEVIQLMTVHQSKGLEFDWVILPSVNNSGFPLKTKEAYRILFVAVTRARKRLTVCRDLSGTLQDAEWDADGIFGFVQGEAT